MRGFAERVGLRRFAAPPRRSIPLIAVEGLGRRPIFRVVGTAVGWAVLLVSTSVEVCVARERARGPESRRSRELACRALCRAARRCQRCAPRALWPHFGCHALFAFYSACGRLFCRRLGEVWLWSALFGFLRVSGAKPDI